VVAGPTTADDRGVIPPRVIEVYADVTCPFAHVGLRRLVEARARRRATEPVIRVRAWPLELVNGTPLTADALAPKIRALRACTNDEPRFAAFGADNSHPFPTTSLPALAAEAAAYRIDDRTGERFALAIRHALFERGQDVGDVDVVAAICREHGTPVPDGSDAAAVLEDLRRGVARGVRGSPHFFVGDVDAFCPALRIRHVGDAYEIDLDVERFAAFEGAIFGPAAAA